MSTNRARQAAIRKSKIQRLLATIERYNRDGTPTDSLASYYTIIPIPRASDLEPLSFRLWVHGHAEEEYPSFEAARRGIMRRVKADTGKPTKNRSDDAYIPF